MRMACTLDGALSGRACTATYSCASSGATNTTEKNDRNANIIIRAQDIAFEYKRHYLSLL